MFLIVTSKRIKLQSPAKSQTVGNSFTLLYLMWIFNIGWDSTEILLPEVEQFFKNEISLLSVKCKNYVYDHNFLTNKSKESRKVSDFREFFCASKPHHESCILFNRVFLSSPTYYSSSWAYFATLLLVRAISELFRKLRHFEEKA